MGCKSALAGSILSPLQRINSYIVGCKLEYDGEQHYMPVRINSYIVGCKYFSR